MTDKRKYEIELQQALINSGQFPTCISCEEWHGTNEVCSKYNNAKPPASVIVVGCVMWIKTIPF